MWSTQAPTRNNKRARSEQRLATSKQTQEARKQVWKGSSEQVKQAFGKFFKILKNFKKPNE